MAHVVLPSAPVPDELHLAVERDGKPFTEPYDRGVPAVFAYSIPADRGAGRGATTRPVSRRSLIEDERDGRAVVQVDAAEGFADGLSVIGRPARRPRLLPLAPARVRARPMSAADGIWAETIRQISSSGSAWMLLEVAQHGAVLNLVVDPAPEEWRTRAATALGPRPHPEIVVVDGLGSIPRVWRRAALELVPDPLSEPEDRRGR